MVLAGLVVGYVVVFGTLTWAQQSNYGTFGFDMGIYDQGIWLLSRFRVPFVTVRGLNYFGHHVNPVTLLLVPAYWLGAGPHLLYLVETVWMAAGAVPVWLLARDRLADPWAAVALAGAYLLYPSLEWVNWWHFHPDALIIAPLLGAYWLAVRGRWGWFAVAVGVALACKEDAALAVLALGGLLVVRGERRAGLATAAAGVVWFVLAVKLVIPAANGGGGPFYQDFFPGFGDSVTAIAYNVVRHPSRVLQLVTGPGRLTYYEQLLVPVALLPLASIPVLLIGGPQTLINVVSGHGYAHEIRYHYSSIVIAAVFLATVESCALLGRRTGTRRLVVGLVVATSLVCNVAWSPSPIGVHYRSGVWTLPRADQAAVDRAVSLVPADAGVSATYDLVPHLTHRVHVYEFPNPWVVTNWALRGEHPPDPGTVDYLVLDSGQERMAQPLHDRLLGPRVEFHVIYEAAGVLVAMRNGTAVAERARA
jgi:uncharacterized membrane protein